MNAMPLATVVCWGVLGVIHVLPALALFRSALISRLYSVDAGTITFLLLQHRAALFLAVCAACLWAAVRPESRPLASVTVAISMVSFLLLYALAGWPAALRTIAIADLIGLPFLALVTWQAFRS
jgi:hypothetical protein